MQDTIYIGTTPGEEACAQTGRPNAEACQRLECRAYIAALKKVHGEPPEGATLRIAGQAHDFGTYHEVRCVYDTDLPEARSYAWKVENGLGKWAEADMWPPITYDDKGDVLLTIADPELWDRTANPGCHPTKERRDAAAQAAKTETTP